MTAASWQRVLRRFWNYYSEEDCVHMHEQSCYKSCRVENMEKKKALIEKLSSIDENMDIEEASTLVRATIRTTW